MDKEDTQKRVGSGQGQGSRPANLYWVRSLGCCQAAGRLVSVTVFELWDSTILGAVSAKTTKIGPLSQGTHRDGGERQINRWL